MSVLRLDTPGKTRQPSLTELAARLLTFIRPGKAATQKIDLDSLPLERQRDLGFRDGRGPSPDHDKCL